MACGVSADHVGMDRAWACEVIDVPSARSPLIPMTTHEDSCLYAQVEPPPPTAVASRRRSAPDVRRGIPSTRGASVRVAGNFV